MTVYLVCSVSVTLLRVEYAVPHTIVQGTGHSSTGIPVTFWLSTQGTEDKNQDVILTNGTPGAWAGQAAGLASDSGSKPSELVQPWILSRLRNFRSSSSLRPSRAPRGQPPRAGVAGVATLCARRRVGRVCRPFLFGSHRVLVDGCGPGRRAGTEDALHVQGEDDGLGGTAPRYGSRCEVLSEHTQGPGWMVCRSAPESARHL